MSESSPRPYESRPTEPSEWQIAGFHDVAESCEQGFIDRTLLSSLENLLRARGRRWVFAASDNFFAWKKGDPTRCVRPDVYLLDNPPDRIPKGWRTWLPDNPPPRWALEVVFDDWPKDYDQGPTKYEELGCRELVIISTRRAAPPTTRGASR